MNNVEHSLNEIRELLQAALGATAKFPKAMDKMDMARAFGVSPETIRRWDHKGDLKPFELPRAIGKKRWSGELVQRSFNGRVGSVNGRAR